MRQTTKQAPGMKVVPFNGEFYQPTEPQPQPQNQLTGLWMFGIAALIGVGYALGSVAAYESPDQVQLRSLQSDSAQLVKVKEQVCK
ncbi:MAG: hypothetical protein HC773_03215 [Scytonema sp. CRU_2_7]|nr:hypothetical protein [Scytonema sp. CRU_2_7]